MLPLRELQARFLRSIATTPERSDVHRFDPVLLELVEGRGRLGSPERLSVYAEMYWARLLDVLRDDFPRVAAVLGGDRFTALAGAYLKRHPSTDPSVRWVGADFADFLAERGPVDEQPFLADLARLEWTRLAVFDAADAVPLRLEALRAIPPSKWPRLTFHPVPALRVLRCAWPVHELWAADDPKAAAATVRPAATVLRVWREAFSVYQTHVDTVEHVALRQLLAGAPFGVMCDRLKALLPPPAVAREAGALVLRWVEDQILASPRAPSRRGRAQ
ncbi:MAG TPA: DNA-binding domain-containing protein [Solirubrobacteraceae bacterium]|jgi:hypothetical protein|nr:DNA-binding domain-containing protein [Solirubrobacteraceae bacterium]